jgi:hypothetical protein
MISQEQNTPGVTEQDVLPLLTKWQDILRLRDWDIRIQIVRTAWRKSGDVKVDLEDKKALLLVNERSYDRSNLEELVVHELLHVKLYPLDQMVEDLLNALYDGAGDDPKRKFAHDQFMTALEATVEDLTKGYLAAREGGQPLSFGRLQRQIDEEKGRGFTE